MVLPAFLDPSSPIDNSFGALYVGTVFSAILYGICILQAFHYFMRYRKDMWYFKTAVITLIASDTINMFLIASLVYHYVIRNYHNQIQLTYLVWQSPFKTLFVIANGAIVQVFYIYRIFKLSQNKLLCAFILFFVFCQVVIGIIWVTLTWLKVKYLDVVPLIPVTITLNVLSCAIDILITASLCFLLHRSRTGFKRLDTMINKLILFVISTGALTTVFAILVFIFMLALPFTLIYVGFYFCLGRLYTNSFLATLNSRSTVDDDIELNPHSLPRRGTRETAPSRPRNINILIDTTQEMRQDREETTRDTMTSKGHIESDGDSFPKREHGLA